MSFPPQTRPQIDGPIPPFQVSTTEHTSGAEEQQTTRPSSSLNVRQSPTWLIVGEAITDLLEKGFKPRRTLILSHGFDEEEVFARRGQGTIAPFLEKRYGKDGILMVIDEGSGTDDDVRLIPRFD